MADYDAIVIEAATGGLSTAAKSQSSNSLSLVGASTRRGGGVPIAIVSGMIAAGQIMKNA